MSVIPSLASRSSLGGPRSRGAAPALVRLEERLAPAANGTVADLVNGSPSNGAVVAAAAAAAAPVPTITPRPTAHFILQVYQDVLGRQALSGEVSYWRNFLDSGVVSRAQMTAIVTGSQEYAVRIVTDTYQNFFGREPAESELAWWVNRFRAGVPGRELESAFLRADEFYTQHQTNWIDDVYREALGRAADAAGASYWNQRLAAGTPRGQIINALLNSSEGRINAIVSAYRTFLRREPDPAGQVAMARFLQTGASPTDLLGRLVGSAEYAGGTYTDFSGVVAPDPVRTSEPKIGPLPGITTPQTPQDPNKPVPTSTPTPPPTTSTEKGIVPRNPPLTTPPGGVAGGARGPDINVTNNLNENHVELSLATNPTDPNNVAIFTTTQDNTGLTSVDLYFSFDGGNSWTLNRIDQAEDGIAATFRFDPNLVYDANGILYLVYGISTNPGGNTGQSYVIAGRSSDGGRTVQTSIVRQDNQANIFNDKWFMAAGPAPAGQVGQYVYITWTQFAGNNSPIVISGSVDGGVTWSAPTQVSDGTLEQLSSPAVGPDGTIYVTWNGTINNTSVVAFDRSATFNGQAGSFTFGADIAASVNVFQPFIANPPSQFNRGISVAPVLAADRSAGPNAGNLYITFADQAPGNNVDDFDTYVIRSLDRGTTWSQRVRVNDEAGTNTQFNPWIAVDQVGSGCIQTSWRDARLSPTNTALDIFSATSEDGGLTWSTNTRISDASSDDSGSADPNNFLEYDGLDFVNGRAYFAWSDNSRNINGNKDIFYDTLVTSCGGVPDDLLEPNETSDHPTNIGSLRVGSSFTVADLNINRHPQTLLPDYDWYRFRAEQDGEFQVAIGGSVGNLELEVFTKDANNTLIPLALDAAPGQGTRNLRVRFRAGQTIFVEVKGINVRPGILGQGSYTLSVNYVA